MKEDPQDNLLILDEKLRRMADDVPEVPDGFHASWLRAVEDEMNQNPESTKAGTEKKPFGWKRWTSIAAAAVILIGGTVAFREKAAFRNERQDNSPYTASEYPEAFSDSAVFGAGSASDTYVSMEDSAPAEYAGYEEAESDIAVWQMSGDEDTAISDPARMIIRNISLSLSTRNFDFYASLIPQKCAKYGGWVESSNISTSSRGSRTASMTLRVPADQMDTYLTTLESDELIVLRRSETASDVSESYQDTATRLATQRALLERLQNMVASTATLEDLLQLEREIADIQYSIDRLQGSLNSTERKVRYATVDITLTEISETKKAEVKQLSFPERLGSALKSGLDGFGEFLEDLVLFLAESLPVLLLLATVITAIVLIRRAHRKHKASAVATTEEHNTETGDHE